MYKPATFAEKVKLGPYEYELYFNGQNVNLAYRNRAIGNRHRVASGLQFWGDEDPVIYDDLELNTNAFALAQLTLPVIAHRMAELQPLEFNLEANSARKIRPYQRFGRRLHRYLNQLYDIEYTKRGVMFVFNKKPKDQRQNLPLPVF